jgi:hypothetical protein
LLEATGDGLYSGSAGTTSAWEPNNAARRDHLVASGVNVTTIQYTPDGEIIALYSDPADLFGARIEFVDAARREQMDRWIAGEPWTD